MRGALWWGLGALLCLLCTTQTAYAQGQIRQPGAFGIGIGAGTVAAGVSGKYFASSDLAFQGTVGLWSGWGWGRNYRRGDDGLALGLDVLFERPTIVGTGDVSLDWHLGPGVSMAFDEAGRWLGAVSFVAGLEANLHIIPLDIVLDYRPSLFLFEDDLDIELIEFGVHLRYYFL